MSPTTLIRSTPRATKGTVRLEVRLISPQALAQYMAFRRLTVRGLADKVGVSPATISHLRTGRRHSTSPATARRIEEALDAPTGSLFVPRLYHVSRNEAA